MRPYLKPFRSSLQNTLTNAMKHFWGKVKALLDIAVGVDLKVGSVRFADVLFGMGAKIQVPLKALCDKVNAVKSAMPAGVWRKLNKMAGGALELFASNHFKDGVRSSEACKKHAPQDKDLSFLVHEKSDAEVKAYAAAVKKEVCPQKPTAEELKTCFKVETP